MITGMSEEYWNRQVKDLNLQIDNLTFVSNMKQEEIERLTELCNKYEEEHKTTFETWQKDIKENKKLHSIIKEAREYATQHMMELAKRKGINGEENGAIYVSVADLLEILDKVGSDKE